MYGMHACTYVCRLHVCVRPRLISRAFLNHTLSYSLHRAFQLNQEFAEKTSVASVFLPSEPCVAEGLLYLWVGCCTHRVTVSGLGIWCGDFVS